MSEEKKVKYVLFKVAKELNVGTATLVDFLNERNFGVTNDPNLKLSADMYDALVKEFASDKKLKEKAALPAAKPLAKELKPLTRLGEMPTPMVDAPAPTAAELRSAILHPGKEAPAAEPVAEGPKLKVLGKIDLDQFKRKPTPKAQDEAPPVAESKPEPVAKPAASAPIVTEPSVTEAKTEAQAKVHDTTAAQIAAAAAAKAAKKPLPVQQPSLFDSLTLAAKPEPPNPPEPKAEPVATAEVKPEVKPEAMAEVAKPQPVAEAPKAPEPTVVAAPQPPKAVEAPTPAVAEPPKAPEAQVEAAKPAAPAQPVADTKAPEAEKAKPTEAHKAPVQHPVAEKPADVVAPKIVAPPIVAAPVAQAPAAPAETPATAAPMAEEDNVIRAKDHAPKLSGLKILGKIELPTAKPAKGKPDPKAPQGQSGARPASAADESEEAKRKRKRKRKTATGTALPPVTPQAASSTQRPAQRPAAGGKGKPNEVSKKEVDSNVRNTLAEMGRGAKRTRQKMRRDKRDERAARRDAAEMERLAGANTLEVTEFLTANELANLMNVNVNQVIAKCLELGIFVSINQRIDAEVIQLIAEEFGYDVRFISLDESYQTEAEEEEVENDSPRAPIVTVMGHVDHGKTSLLDYIRKTNVTAREAGGITQHIGAYNVKLDDDRSLTFLDTPGHEAFTAMRARGAKVTDIAIIVIAADDQVMPQTREAINHAQAANVPMVFAINKIDKDGAQPEKIKEQLAGMNLLVEDWGGKYQCQEISAKKGVGINELLEKVLLEAEMLDLKCNPEVPARGTVIEAQLDKGRGIVATMLVLNGTLRIGDIVLANCFYGKVKAMFDQRQQRVKEAGPAVAVQILGLDGVPQAGDKFIVMKSEREARELAAKRQQLLREQSLRMRKHLTLEEIARRSRLGDFNELNVIVKGDVDGSVEALADALLKLSTEEVVVNIVMKGVGQISENDVLLASASKAIIVGFQVRPSNSARKLAAQEMIDIRLYSVIYDAINEIKDALEGLLKPKIEEEVVGVADVREVFRISKVGAVAGCMITEGKINRNSEIRLIRDGIVVFTGKIAALKRHKDDAREVAQGFECGISIENFNDIKVGDSIEAFTKVEVKRTLD